CVLCFVVFSISFISYVCLLLFLFSSLPPLPHSTLFPYTTLFRSKVGLLFVRRYHAAIQFVEKVHERQQDLATAHAAGRWPQRWNRSGCEGHARRPLPSTGWRCIRSVFER